MFYELKDIKREKESENQEEILTKKDKKSFIYLELKGLKGSKGEVVLSKGNRFFIFSEVVARRCSVKKWFLENSQNLRENTCARVSFLIKLEAYTLQLYLKRDSGTGVFL